MAFVKTGDKQELFVITAPKVVDTGRVSYVFVIRSGAPTRACSMATRYGLAKLEDRDENEIDPFKLARGEPGAVGPNGVKRWRLNMGSGAKQDFAASVDEAPDEAGLVGILPDMGDGVLLMERQFYDRFEKAAQKAGVHLEAHHCGHELVTG